MKKIISIVLSLVMLVSCFAIGASAATVRNLDLAFVVDTTGSMYDDIYEVQQNMKEYLDDLDASGMNYRIAIIDYRDFPEHSGYGDYPYKVQLDFSNDYDAILTAINGLTLGSGGDWEETIYSALIDGLDELSWRAAAGKAAIVMGDAPALDPERVTGYTRDMVIEKMETGKIAVGGLEKAARDSAEVSRTPITLFTIATDNDAETVECFEALATETGGKSYTAENSDEITDAIIEIIEEIPETVEPGEEEDESFGLFDFIIEFFAIIIYIVTFQWLF